LGADLHPSFRSWIEPNTAHALTSAIRIITLSFASARNLAQLGVDPERIDVVPLGVDVQQFRPGLTGGRELVAQADGDDRPYVVSVATLFKGKNLLLLREAVARLVDRGFPHRLVLVTGSPGDGSDPNVAMEELLSPEARFGNAPVLLQRLSDAELAAVIAGATAFCLPSRFEGFGIPALEALACGVPTIVSDRGALPEVVGDSGIIVEPQVEAIERALAEVITNSDLAAKLSISGRQRAESFTWERTARGWATALARATAKRQPHQPWVWRWLRGFRSSDLACNLGR
jgi:glycosyltransferase involved in cell wall biosynthesis